MDVEVTTLELDARLKNAEETIRALERIHAGGKKAEESFGGLALRIAGFTSLADVGVRAGQQMVSTLIDLGKQSVILAASFEKSRMTWGVLVGDMSKGTEVFDRLYQFAARSPLSFEGVNQAATTIKGFGVATEDLIPTLSRLGDIAMGDNAKLSQLALVYGQVFAQGKAKTQDLYQFINAGVPIFNLLAQSMGKSTGEIKEIAASGAVTFEEIEKAITKATSAGGQFYNMAETLAQSASGKWTRAQDDWNTQLAKLGETILPTVTSALDAATAAMDRWNRAREGAKTAVKTVSLTDIVGRGDAIGAADFVMSNMGVNPQMVWDALAYAQKANPNPTNAQAAALAAANQAVEDFKNKGLASSKTSYNAPTSSSGNKNSGPSSSMMFGWYGYTDPRNENRHFVGAGEEFTEPSPNPYSDYADPRRAGSHFVGPDQGDVNMLKDFTTLMKELGPSMQSVATGAVVSGFESIGKALASGASGAQSLAASIGSIGQAAAAQTGSLMITAGLQEIIKGNPMGWALLAAGGGLSIMGGAWGQSMSGSSASSSPDLSAVQSYYMQTEAFNGRSRSTAPSAARAIAAPSGGVSIVINNNAPGVDVGAVEGTGPDGSRQIVVNVEKIVQGLAARGGLDSALAVSASRRAGRRLSS